MKLWRVMALAFVASLAWCFSSSGCNPASSTPPEQLLPSASETPADEEFQEECRPNCTMADEFKIKYWRDCLIKSNGPTEVIEKECTRQINQTMAWLPPDWRE